MARSIFLPSTTRSAHSDMDGQLTGPGKAYAVFLFLIASCALGVVGVTVATLFFVGENNFQILVQSLQIIDEGLAGTYIFLLSSPIALGLVVFILCSIEICIAYRGTTDKEDNEKAFEIFGSDKVKRCAQKSCGSTTNCWFTFLYIAILFVVILQACGFGAMLRAVNAMDESLASGGKSSGNGDFEKQANNFQFVLFNECCANNNHTEQGKVESCEVVGDVTDCDLPGKYSLFKNDLCVCHTLSSPEYVSHKKAIQESDLCVRLEDAIVEFVPDQKIPGTSISVKVMFEDSQARVVGFHGQPEDNPDRLAKDPKGSGCGTGIVRGMQFMYLLYAKQETEKTAFWGLGLSLAQLVLLLMSLCLFLNTKVDPDARYRGSSLANSSFFGGSLFGPKTPNLNSKGSIVLTPDFLRTKRTKHKPGFNKSNMSSIDLSGHYL